MGTGRRQDHSGNHSEKKWIIVRIDGKIAAISTDYSKLAEISSLIAARHKNTGPATGKSQKGSRKQKGGESHIFKEISAVTADFDEVWRLRKEASWEDMILFGTDFQKRVWRMLWELTHSDSVSDENINLISYSDFAELCQNRAGVRAVAHAIGLNPVSVVIPCHLVIPKESIDKIKEIHKKAEATIFKGDDLCINSILSDSSIDFGEYSLGRGLKRELVLKEIG